jgi:hypothetical protein
MIIDYHLTLMLGGLNVQWIPKGLERYLGGRSECLGLINQCLHAR